MLPILWAKGDMDELYEIGRRSLEETGRISVDEILDHVLILAKNMFPSADFSTRAGEFKDIMRNQTVETIFKFLGDDHVNYEYVKERNIIKRKLSKIT